MQQVTPLPQGTGASKSLGAENFIIFDKVQVPPESTSTEAELPTSDKSESTPTSKGRKRHGKISQKDILGILKSVAFQVRESGMPTTVAVLPKNSFAIIVQGAWACVKCGEFYPGISSLDGVCVACKASA